MSGSCLLRLARASKLLTGFHIAESTAASRCQVQSRLMSTVSTSARFLDVGPNILFEQRRFTNFYNKLPAEKLWKSVTTVSNPGKKRGRGKGRSKILSKDLNRGQIIGQGKMNMVWPGLNAPVFRGRELVRQQELPEDPDREKRLLELRDHMSAFRTLRIPPLERGWSGNWLPGRKVGPPDPIGDEKFEGFDTVVLECKTVSTMTGNLGRRFTYSIFVVTGNGNGVGGFALGKAPSLPAALRKARNRAGQKLIHIERYEDHSVMHDFHSQFGKSRINVHKAPKGFGLVCHRAVRSTCQMLGIKDLQAKVEPSARKNVQNLTKAFFLGLMRQKNFDDMAKETGFLLVERNPDRLGYPRLLAEPEEEKRLETEAAATRVPDFQSYCFGNRVEYVKRKDVGWYKRLPSWQTHLKKRHKFRNMDDVKMRMLVDHGEVRSMYTEKYPDECVPPIMNLKRKEKDS